MEAMEPPLAMPRMGGGGGGGGKEESPECESLRGDGFGSTMGGGDGFGSIGAGGDDCDNDDDEEGIEKAIVLRKLGLADKESETGGRFAVRGVIGGGRAVARGTIEGGG